jgi:hypothetical protein
MKVLKWIKSKLFFNLNIENLQNAIIEDCKIKSGKIGELSENELTDAKLKFIQEYYKR